MRSRRSPTLAVVVCLLILGQPLLLPAVAGAQQAPPKAGVVTGLKGHATLARLPSPERRPLNFRDDVLFRDRIGTEQDSIVRVLMGGKALVTIRELSDVTITEEATRSVVNMGFGRLALQVLKRLLRPGESVEVYTPNAVAAVRGSFLVTACDSGPQGAQCSFSALEVSDPTAAPTTFYSREKPSEVFTLGPKQTVSVLGEGAATTLSPIRNLTPQEAADLARTADAPRQSGHSDRPPSELIQQVGDAKIQEASQLAALLAPGGPGFGLLAGGPEIRGQEFDPNININEDPGRLPECPPPCAPPPPQGSITPPIQPGEKRVLGPGEKLVDFSGIVNRDSPDPVREIPRGASVVQPGPTTLLNVNLGADVTINGKLLRVEDAAVSTGASLLEGKGKLTNNSNEPLLFFDPSFVKVGADIAAFSGAGANVTLFGSLLSDLQGTFSVGRNVLTISGGAKVDATGSPSALLKFDQSNVGVGLIPGEGGGRGGDVLVFGSDGRGGDRNNLAATLRNLGKTVTVANALPGDLSSFSTIWHVAAFAPLTNAERASLTAFLASGGGVHLTGERPCCEALNAGAQALINAVVIGGGVAVGGRGDIGGPYPFNPVAAGGVTLAPNILAQWFPPAPGGIAGVAGPNVLVSGAGGVPVGAVWSSGSLVGGTGQLTLLMDIDWFNAGNRQPIVENIQNFLGVGGAPTPAVPPQTLITLDNGFLISGGSLVESLAANILVQKAALQMSNGSDAQVLSQPAFVVNGGRFQAERLANVEGSTLTLGDSLLDARGHDAVQLTLDVAKVGSTLTSASELIKLTGTDTALDEDSGLILGTEEPLKLGGSLVRSDGGTVNVGGVLKMDPALLNASVPLLNLTGGANLTSTTDAFQIAGQSHLMSTAASLVRLDASSMNIVNGHLFNVTGASKLATAGDLVTLIGGANLNILSGALLNVVNSIVSIGGALINFGAGGGTVNITNNLCGAGCVNFGPIRVAASGGAVVNIANPVKGAGAINYGSPNSAAVMINGGKLTVRGL